MSEPSTRSLREELESRVLALLTGELPEADADELEKILTVDEELSDFRDRMATLMGEVHTARDEISPPAVQPPLRLSEERRREIFGDEVTVEITSKKDSKKWWHMGLLEIAAMFILVGVLAAIMIPSVGAVRKSSQEASERADARSAGIERQMAESANFKVPEEASFMAPQEEMKSKLEGVEVSTESFTVSSGLGGSGVLGGDSGGFARGKKNTAGERLMQDESNVMNMDQIESDQSYAYASSDMALNGYVESAPVDAAKPSQTAPSRSGPVDPFAAPAASAEPANELEAFFQTAGVAFQSSGVAEPVNRAASSPEVPRGGAQRIQIERKSLEVTKMADTEVGFDWAASAQPAPPAASQPGYAMAGAYGDADLRTDTSSLSKARDGGNNEYDLADDDGAESKTRSDMLASVDQAWERAKVFEMEESPSASALLVNKLDAIVIPQVNFSGMPLSKVIETLEELSVEYDPERRGVQIAYAPPADGADPRVNISLRNLNLDRILQFVTQQTNFSYDRGENGVIVQQMVVLSNVEKAAIARNELTRQTPKAEKSTREAPVSTFSLNVSDVSFKLAQAALSTQRIPAAELIRTEEFVNSFNYGDPTPRENEAVTLNWEIAQHPFAHNRQIVRFSLQTQAAGRAANQPLNLNLLIDNSGSMQRPDRRAILEQSLQALQGKLTDQDRLNIVLFARQPTLIANASTVSDQRAAIARALDYQPQGGTNLESGLKVAYDTAGASYNPAASNRVILMTDGAANLGDVDSANLAQMVIEQRKQGIALDAYGIGWEDYNDALLEEITRNGDGRYAFLNSADTAAADFAEKLAGTLRVGAADVKVQIIWNPERVTAYRQIGYDLHQLREQDFRDNTVDAAEIGEAESGTALYVLKINSDPELTGALGKLQVRYRVPATGEYVERAWPLEMPRQIPDLDAAPASLRLAATSALFAERLANNPYAANYNFDELEALTRGLPEAFPTQSRVTELQNMIQTANTLFTRFE